MSHNTKVTLDVVSFIPIWLVQSPIKVPASYTCCKKMTGFTAASYFFGRSPYWLCTTTTTAHRKIRDVSADSGNLKRVHFSVTACGDYIRHIAYTMLPRVPSRRGSHIKRLSRKSLGNYRIDAGYCRRREIPLRQRTRPNIADSA